MNFWRQDPLRPARRVDLATKHYAHLHLNYDQEMENCWD